MVDSDGLTPEVLNEVNIERERRRIPVPPGLGREEAVAAMCRILPDLEQHIKTYALENPHDWPVLVKTYHADGKNASGGTYYVQDGQIVEWETRDYEEGNNAETS